MVWGIELIVVGALYAGWRAFRWNRLNRVTRHAYWNKKHISLERF